MIFRLLPTPCDSFRLLATPADSFRLLPMPFHRCTRRRTPRTPSSSTARSPRAPRTAPSHPRASPTLSATSDPREPSLSHSQQSPPSLIHGTLLLPHPRSNLPSLSFTHHPRTLALLRLSAPSPIHGCHPAFDSQLRRGLPRDLLARLPRLQLRAARPRARGGAPSDLDLEADRAARCERLHAARRRHRRPRAALSRHRRPATLRAARDSSPRRRYESRVHCHVRPPFERAIVREARFRAEALRGWCAGWVRPHVRAGRRRHGQSSMVVGFCAKGVRETSDGTLTHRWR